MISLRVGQTLARMSHAYASAQRSRRYFILPGLTLVLAITTSLGVTMARWGNPYQRSIPERSPDSAPFVSPAIFPILSTAAAPLALRDVSSQGVTSVSAASFEETPVAPESIVAAFGLPLATQTAVATDANPNTPEIELPTQLGGTTVEVNGRRAELFYVSPGQVNYVMPAATEPGFASVVVKSGDGTTLSGTVQVAQVSPAIFTANPTGRGVPAAYLLRVKADGQLSYESPFQWIGATGSFHTKPIDMGPPGDKVNLVLFLTGVRRAVASGVRVLIGGDAIESSYSGLAPGFVGLDQINVEIPRSLIGRGNVSVSVTSGGVTSNLTDIELAGIGGATPPQVSGFGQPQALAGRSMVINGSGFHPVAAQNTVRIAGHEAEVMAATQTSLTVMVPFGVETGTVRVITPSGEGVSQSILPVLTSISGVVETTSGEPLKGVKVTVKTRDRSLWETTNADGHFVVHDVPPGVHSFEADGGTVGVDPPFPLHITKITVQADRDNAIPDAIALQQSTGNGGTVGQGTEFGGDGRVGIKVALKNLDPQPVSIETEKFRLEVQPSTRAKFPNSATIGDIFLTPLKNARAPVELPFKVYSSSIVQITPFGVELDPGAKLIFPNTDQLPKGAQPILFRYDPDSGKFLQDEARVYVSADGNSIETEQGAIKTTSYYFAAVPRDKTTTITGRVFERDGKPIKHALARSKGQEGYTDGNGAYTLRFVPIKEKEKLIVEISTIRSNGRVDREKSESTEVVEGGVTKVRDVRMPFTDENRPPTIIGPTRLVIAEGGRGDFKIVINDPDPNDTNDTISVKVEDAPFATIIRGGLTAATAFTLRLTPNFSQAGTYPLKITATDRAGIGATHRIDVTVKDGNRAPTANNQIVIVDEDTPGAIRLDGSDPDGNSLKYAVVSQPANGKLSGNAPNLTYTPDLNFSGTDRFTFRANDGALDSNEATVMITVRAINDAPVLTAPGAHTAIEGQPINLTISASDPDAGQKLNFAATGLPAGAALVQTNSSSAQYRWRPGFAQAGAYSVKIIVTDDATPSLSDTKDLHITVFDTRHDLADDPADLTVIGREDALPPLRGSGAGSSVAIGDLDGDGIDDLVVGAPADGAVGKVHIFLGRGNPRGSIDLARTPADVTITGEAFDDLFGSSLAIGDISADGKADLIIGAPAADRSPNAPDSGKIYSVFGNLSPGDYDIAKIANLTIIGAAADDEFGTSLAIGRLGGASAPEALIVGAPLSDVPGVGGSLPDAGCAYGFFGGATLSGVKDLGASSADFTVAGIVANGRLGASLATGNFNADNLVDLAIGAPAADFGALKAAGVVYLVPGSQSLKGLVNASQSSALLLSGADSGDAAGASLAMGDLNGDGYADLIIGAPGADGPNESHPGSGEVYVVFGMPVVEPRLSQLTIFGAGANIDEFPDGLGASLAVGDFTGDGTLDLIIGAPGADSSSSTRRPTGAAYFIFGGRSFTAGTFDLSSQDPDLKIFGAKPGDRLGEGGFAFGKLDLSGANELAIGVPAASRGETVASGAGEVRVLRGVVR